MSRSSRGRRVADATRRMAIRDCALDASENLSLDSLRH